MIELLQSWIDTHETRRLAERLLNPHHIEDASPSPRPGSPLEPSDISDFRAVDAAWSAFCQHLYQQILCDGVLIFDAAGHLLFQDRPLAHLHHFARQHVATVCTQSGYHAQLKISSRQRLEMIRLAHSQGAVMLGLIVEIPLSSGLVHAVTANAEPMAPL